jgi:hypothetical protein
MRRRSIRTATVVAATLLLGQAGAAGPGGTKQLLIPDDGKTSPKVNDYTNPDSDYCYRRMVASDDFVLFWHKSYGSAPAANPDEKKRFSVDRVLAEAERYYAFYVNQLRWFGSGTAAATRYKMVIYVTDNPDGTAYGSASGPVGLFWTPASRINQEPFGVVAHELGHSFQIVIRADGCWAFSDGRNGPFFEMTSQFMLWQVLPQWQTFERYHLLSYLKQTHLAFLHEDNQYHSPYVLEYWSAKHGQPFIGRMWREARKGEDPVMTYKRLAGLNQAGFNPEMFDAARRFVTWDLPRIEKAGAKYANLHTSALTPVGDESFQAVATRCPQNYGYNAIKLKVPAFGTRVGLDFTGLPHADGFHSVHPELAGWRYGFLASLDDGRRVYGPACADPNGKTGFVVPPRTKFLWLVVMGAPTEHWTHVVDKTKATNEQWPYRIRLTNTAPDDSVIQH